MTTAPDLVDSMPRVDIAFSDRRTASLLAGRDALAALATEMVEAGWIPPGAVTELEAGPEPVGWMVVEMDPNRGRPARDWVGLVFTTRDAAEEIAARVNAPAEPGGEPRRDCYVVAVHHPPLPEIPADGVTVETQADPHLVPGQIFDALSDLMRLVPVHDTSDPVQAARARIHLAERAVQLAALLVRPSDMLAAAQRHHTIAPVLDPTTYRAALDGLADVETLMTALLPAEALYLSVASAHGPRS